jgi:acyl-CoA reductase-like NAD-dependent aldehyde dehydrogenase
MAYKLLINGKLVDGAKTLEVFNPATGGVLETCPRADEAQLDEAVAAAKATFPAWSALSFSERRVKLEAIADALEARTDEFARLLTQEQGKPIAQATGEVMGAVALAQMPTGRGAVLASEKCTCTTRQSPLPCGTRHARLADRIF